MGLFDKIKSKNTIDDIKNKFTNKNTSEAKYKNILNSVASIFAGYDLDSKEGILAIPNKQNILQSFKDGTFNDNIISKLQRKATEYKKEENEELCLLCLEKHI